MDFSEEYGSDYLKIRSDAMVGVVRSLGLAKIILCIFLTAWPQTSTVFTHAKNAPNFYTNGWAIRVEGGIETAKRIARSHGFERVEPVSI